MNSNFWTYQVGATQVVIGASLATQVVPARGVHSWVLKKLSGGTLAVVGGAGATLFTTTNGYILGDTEVFPIAGPATFFLCASGATAVAGLVANYGAGYSLTP